MECVFIGIELAHVFDLEEVISVLQAQIVDQGGVDRRLFKIAGIGIDLLIKIVGTIAWVTRIIDQALVPDAAFLVGKTAVGGNFRFTQVHKAHAVAVVDGT